MIQEIAPAYIWNTYEEREPQADSTVICVRNGDYCIIHTAQGDRFPLYRELKPADRNGLQYLFALRGEDGRRDFFLCICEASFSDEGIPSHAWEAVSYINHQMQPRVEAFAGMTAHHLYVWHQNNQFCGRCGARTVHDHKERMMCCPSCGNMVFPKIAPAVLAAVRHNGKLLLTKYAHGDGNYALVAGFVEIGETAEQCVAREVMEETGLRVKNVTYYDSQPWGFAGNLMLAYTAELDGEDDTIRVDRSELALAEWVAPEEIPEISDYNSLTREMIRRFRLGKL